MNLKSKIISLLILGLTAGVCARTMLTSFDDPEGSNLLITTLVTMFIFVLSLAVYRGGGIAQGLPKESSRLRPRTLLWVIVIQVLITAVLYLCLK